MLGGILLIASAATVINFLTFLKLYTNMVSFLSEEPHNIIIFQQRVAQDASVISRTRGHYRMLFQV